MIRPLKRIESGSYKSADGVWHFLYSPSYRDWSTYRGDNNDAYFFSGHPTLKSAVEAVEREPT